MHIYISEGEEQPAISGTVSEFRNIAEYVKRAKLGSCRSYELSQKSTVDPYDRLLNELVLDCNGSKIKGSVYGDCLKLEFSDEYAQAMASYFEFDENAKFGEHWHFDQYGNEDYFDLESIDMVIQIADK